MDPEENFGLWSYEPQQHRLFSEDLAAWGAVKPMYTKSGGPARPRGDGADPQRALARNDLTVTEAEKQLIIRALKETRGNRTLAAKKIGMSRRTLHRKLHIYGLEEF